MPNACTARLVILLIVIAVGGFLSVEYLQDHVYTQVAAIVDARLDLWRNYGKSNQTATQKKSTIVLNTENQNLFRKFKKLFELQAGQRAQYIDRMYNNHKFKKSFKKGIGLLYNILAPEVSCPLKARVGVVEDGGKWVCNPWKVPRNNCKVYSLGINQEISFDLQFQILTNYTCRLHAYDMFPQPASIVEQLEANNADFKVARLGDKMDQTNGQFTITELMKENGDDAIEILKIDIEGSEFQVMPSVFKNVSVCQVLIEMHEGVVKVIELLKEFSKFGFYLFSYETNGYDYKVCEYSFIHKTCMKRYGAIYLAGYLLDIENGKPTG